MNLESGMAASIANTEKLCSESGDEFLLFFGFFKLKETVFCIDILHEKGWRLSGHKNIRYCSSPEEVIRITGEFFQTYGSLGPSNISELIYSHIIHR